MSEFEEKSAELYESFEEALADADCEISTSEFQGILSGMICGGLKATDSSWKRTILEVGNDGNQLPESAQKVLEDINVISARAFREEDFLTPILLPDEDYPLIDRLEALTLWAQGYLLGFGLQHGNQPVTGAEINESLQDISDISQLDVVVDNDEESQAAFITLLEHIKVAVKVIYLEFVFKIEQRAAAPVAGNSTFH
jgi:uncharacterized protein YgfB (UPF0149 family)